MKFQLIIKTPLGEYTSKVMDDKDREGKETLVGLQRIDEAKVMNIVTADNHIVTFSTGVVQQSVFEIVPTDKAG